MLRRLLTAILIAVGLLAHGIAFAQDEANRLELPQTQEVEKGATEMVLPILLTNEVKIAGFQCDLYLPNGFTVATDEYDDYLIDVARTTTKRHSLATREMSDGALRIVLSSMTNATFSGNSGAVLNITVSIANNVTSGNHTVNLKNIVLTNPDASRFTSADVSGNIVVKAAEQPVTITADNLTMIYGDEVPTLTYTSEGAELVGVPSLSCEATSTSPVDTYPIVVSKGTVENNLVTYVNGTLTIAKAPLKIAAGNYTMKQGEALPEFVLTYTGLKNDETKDVLTRLPVVSCKATTASAPGEYPVTVSGAEAQNYEISYTNGKLTVVDADAVVVTAKSYTREYGEANPTFEYTVEGAELEGSPEIICEATATSPVGEYPIIIKKGTVANFNDTYINGVLTITKAPLTITAGNYTMKQGEAMPEFTLTYAGFKNGDTKDVLTKLPTVSCEATELSAPGEYPVIVSGAEALNYDISYTSGKLTVNKPDEVLSDDNRLELSDNITIDEGTTELVLPIMLTNEVKIAGFQCDLYLPDGFTIATDEYDDYLIDVARTTTKRHSLATREMSDGALRIVLSSMTNATFSGNSGAVLNITIAVGKDVAVGNYTVNLKNIVLTNPEATRYTSRDVSGIITIKAPEPITIKANSLTMVYGDTVPKFTYTSEGAELIGVPSLSCEATSTSPVGTYPIVVSKGTAENKVITYVNGTLTITKAPLTIRVGNYEKKQYDPMPEFTVSCEGFKNNETEDVLTKQPVVSCEAIEDSAPGEYAITVSGAEVRNYEIQYVTGKLTVTEPDSYTLTYMVDGEVYKSFSIKYRDAITPLETPTKEGYTFSGWSEIPETMPANDVVVTGTFSVNSYTLTYMVDGEVYKTTPIAYGTALTPEDAPNKEGYTFSGWSEIPATMPAKDVVVTGSFTINSYIITYVLDGEVYTTDTLEYGAEIVVPVIPGLENYTIWEDVPETMPASDITIYGKAKEIIDGIGPIQNSKFKIQNGAEVYDLSGRKVNSKFKIQDSKLPKGIYVVNGKKVAIK